MGKYQGTRGNSHSEVVGLRLFGVSQRIRVVE